LKLKVTDCWLRFHFEFDLLQFGMQREKTVVDVNVTDAEKQAVYTKLVREQSSLHQKISDQQKQQEEMVCNILQIISFTYYGTMYVHECISIY